MWKYRIRPSRAMPLQARDPGTHSGCSQPRHQAGGIRSVPAAMADEQVTSAGRGHVGRVSRSGARLAMYPGVSGQSPGDESVIGGGGINSPVVRCRPRRAAHCQHIRRSRVHYPAHLRLAGRRSGVGYLGHGRFLPGLPCRWHLRARTCPSECSYKYSTFVVHPCKPSGSLT
jgi:hypothetical protein